jgi:DNA polymerase III delta prime subunit
METLRATVRSRETTNLLFYGPPGTGKTSTILALCAELFEDTSSMKKCVLEIDASSERDATSIKQKIKMFCKKSANDSSEYKFIILDEADTLSSDAQSSLRRCMEIYSYNTRFCFLCNYVTRIIPPLQSRCSCFNFSKIDEDAAVSHLKTICETENVPYEEDSLPLLYRHAGGDLRHSIITMQGLAAMDRGILVGHFIPGRITTKTMSNTEAVGVCCTLLAEGHTVREVQESFLLLMQESEHLDLLALETVSKSEKKALDNVPPFVLMLDLLLEFRRMSREVLYKDSCGKG